MSRLLFGLLLAGLTAGVHASEGVLISDQSATRFVGSGTASELPQVFKPEKETAVPAPARWTESVGGNQILSLVHHKHVEFTGEQYKVTLHRDSALIEAGQLRVVLRSGSTSLLWSIAL